MQPRKFRRTKNVSSSGSRDIFDEHAMFTWWKPGASSGNGHLFAPLRDVVVRAPAPEETKVFSPWLPLKTWWQPRWPLGRTIARLGHGDAAHRWPLRESPFDLLLPKTTRGLKKSHRFLVLLQFCQMLRQHETLDCSGFLERRNYFQW